MLESSGTLKITSADGVNASGNNTGNVQCTGTRTFSQTGFYHYVGSSSPQFTGTAITSGSTAKQLVINKTNPTDIVNLTQSTGTSSKLEIIEGIFAESLSAQVTGSGELIMSGGEYRMSVLETTLPQLSGTYTLTGGTINLNGGSGNQTLRGARDYYSLTFSGGGTKFTSSAITNIGDNVTLNQGLVTIKDDNTVLDVQNSGFTGNAGLTMSDNSLFRCRRISASLPELLGVYSLTGGTVELYGSESTQNHTIRGTDGAGSRITYNNVNLNANEANVTFNNANIIVGAGFTVNGTLNINNPACVRIASTLNISGPGTFNVNAGATLKYGSVDGITASANAGNVRTTNRNFSSEASYGFAGISNQVTGDGLPTSVKNIYVDKTDANATVTLTNSIAIETALVMNQGHIITGSNTLELGNSTINKGSLSYSAGYVVGKMRRWFNSTNSGNSSGLFPMAVDETGLKNRNVLVEYTSAPSAGGSLTTEWVSAPMGARGLPIVSGNTGGCSFDITSAYDDGFWKIDNASGTLTDGAYSISVTGEGLSNIENLSELTLLKRVNGGNWFCPGSHNEPTGSIANPTISRAGVSGWSNFGFGGGDANPLPVELISFYTNCDDKMVNILWTTATEVNNSHFVLEYSFDAVNWNYLNTLQGSGNSSTPINYEYTTTQNKFAYFRLIQVDFDGQQTIYGPINSNCGNEPSKLLTKIYPNPFNHEINLFVDDAQSSFFVVEMMDMNGRIVQRNEFFNQSKVVLSTEDLVKGVYTLRVISHSQTENFKMIKQ